jgi:hypothetical protein
LLEISISSNSRNLLQFLSAFQPSLPDTNNAKAK